MVRISGLFHPNEFPMYNLGLQLKFTNHLWKLPDFHPSVLEVSFRQLLYNASWFVTAKRKGLRSCLGWVNDHVQWLGSGPPFLGHLEGEQPYLRDLATMVIIHLVTGMILQVLAWYQKMNGPTCFRILCRENDSDIQDFWLPSRELTYPPKMVFWRWFSFSQGGIC